LSVGEAITCRPADLLEPELEQQTEKLNHIAIEKKINLADSVVDDVLTYALFPQIGIRFLQNRDNPDAFEPAPTGEPEVAAAPAAASPAGGGIYSVRVNGREFRVEVAESGQLESVAPAQAGPAAAGAGGGEPVKAVLAGNIFKVHVAPGVEAMKMETVVSSPRSGTVTDVFVAEGDKVAVGDALLAIG
jgi:oxaloacetate decarboxylase alpha subunit